MHVEGNERRRYSLEDDTRVYLRSTEVQTWTILPEFVYLSSSLCAQAPRVSSSQDICL